MTFCKLISKQYAILNQSIIWFGRKVLPVWTDDSDFRKIKLETGKKHLLLTLFWTLLVLLHTEILT